MGRLDNRTAFITGAGMGIGLGIARAYAKEGANIVIAEYNAEAGQQAADEVRELGAKVLFTHTDVCDKEQLMSAFDQAEQEFGSIEILVNNAWAGGTRRRIENKSDENMLHGFNMGALSGFWGMQRLFPSMKANGGGSIINICSLNGVNAHMYTAEYNAGKEALRAITRTAAREWAEHQIRCNIICPAAASPAYVAYATHNPENAKATLPPMGRMGDPESDIGGVALFLASDESKYLTGNTLFVDGGGHINGVHWAPEPSD